MFANRWIVWIALLGPLGWSGCATPPPTTPGKQAATTPQTYGASRIVVKHGTPHPRVQRLTRIVDWPRRTFRKDSPDPREVSADTIERLVRYLEQNNLTDVTVYVNHYDPQEMWYRLVHNDRVGAGWRYTAGRASLFRLPSLAPRRVRTHRVRSVHEQPLSQLEYARSGRERRRVGKGTPREQPTGHNLRREPSAGFAFLHARRNFREVVEYAKTEDQWDLEQQAYRELCPRLGAESVQIGSYFITVWWGGLALNAAGTAGG